MEKILICILILSLVACSSKTTKETSKEASVKNSAEAPSQIPPPNPTATSEIPSRREFPVNSDYKPCDNFFQYTCSKVSTSFKLRDDRSYHDFAFSDSSERLLEAKKKFMAELGATKKKGSSLHREELRATYQACMNEEASKTEEKLYVSKILNEVDNINTRADFEVYLAKNIVSKDEGFIDFDTTPNLENPDTFDAILLANIQQMPERSYYDNPELMADLQAIETDLLKIIGHDHPEDRARTALAFEKEFSKTYPLPAEFRELFNSKREISRQDLTERFPNLKLDALLSQLPKKVVIRNITPENFEYLNRALDELPLDVLKDSYLIHVLPFYMDDAFPDFFKRRFEFNHKYLGGPPTRAVREERCTKMIMENFTKELDAELLPQLFPHFPTKRVVSLVEKVRQSIIDGVKTNIWLSEQGKAEAIKKLKAARLQLVKPLNDREWDFTPPATYSPKQRYTNYRTLKFNLELKKIRETRKPRDKSRWEMGPLTINAYYSPPDNKFVMPIGILQYPFFDDSLSDETNLGALGAVAGHELGHGIDDKGSRYDEKGRFRQWMPPADLAEFKKRGENLAAQFSVLGINGQLTMGENIGDLVGVASAYRAAFPAGKGSIEAKKAFFLQYTRLWCNVIRPKFKEMLLKTNPHSPGEARGSQPVKNQVGFDEAYDCKAGDAMYLEPASRVHIW